MSYHEPVMARECLEYLQIQPDGTYVCALCSKRFATAQCVKQHVDRMHVQSAAIRCTLCGCISRNEQNFRVHINNKHGLTGIKNIVEAYGENMWITIPFV